MIQTARQKLGEVLTFQFAKQRKSDRDVSDRCGVPIRDVERWKSGELVPDKLQWKRLCQMVAKGLFSCSSLHGDALKEQDEEREATVRALQRNGHTTAINGRVATNFGDKLVMAGVATPTPVVEVAAPAKDQDVQMPHEKPATDCMLLPLQERGLRTLSQNAVSTPARF